MCSLGMRLVCNSHYIGKALQTVHVEFIVYREVHRGASWHMKLCRFQIIMGFRIYNIGFMVLEIGFMVFRLDF